MKWFLKCNGCEPLAKSFWNFDDMEMAFFIDAEECVLKGDLKDARTMISTEGPHNLLGKTHQFASLQLLSTEGATQLNI